MFSRLLLLFLASDPDRNRFNHRPGRLFFLYSICVRSSSQPDTGQAVRVRGTYVTCRHLVCAGSQAERGLTSSGRGATAGADNCHNGYRRLRVGLYTILPLSILCGISCNNGGSGGSIILRNSAGSDGGWWSPQQRVGCAKKSIDSCKAAQNKTIFCVGQPAVAQPTCFYRDGSSFKGALQLLINRYG